MGLVEVKEVSFLVGRGAGSPQAHPWQHGKLRPEQARGRLGRVGEGKEGKRRNWSRGGRGEGRQGRGTEKIERGRVWAGEGR